MMVRIQVFGAKILTLTVILLPHIIQLVGYPGTPRGGLNMCPALGPIRTDADFRLSLTRRVQSATMRQEHIKEGFW